MNPEWQAKARTAFHELLRAYRCLSVWGVTFYTLAWLGAPLFRWVGQLFGGSELAMLWAMLILGWPLSIWITAVVLRARPTAPE